MAPGESGSPPEPRKSGLKQEVTSFIKETSAHARIRGELFAIETKEAAGVYGKTFGFALAGAVLVILSYLLFLVGLIGILGLLISGSDVSIANWIGASWILAGIHLVTGFILIKSSKRAGKNANVYEYTRREFKKDQEWLTNEKKL